MSALGLGVAAALLLAWGGDRPGAPAWREQRYRGHTEYRSVGTGDGATLLASADDANSALLAPLRIDPRGVVLRWRWRVLEHPRDADPEVRARDDRAAGLLVVVRRSWIPGRTRALLYQWTPARPAGQWSHSPYSRRVATVVLRDAPADSSWREEVRDLGADLERAFGVTPERIVAIGVICDADDTGGRASAEFGPIEVLTGVEAHAARAGR
ncbi:MAG: DUF3047 domain-containing protein [Candidatus Eiseniibacteriota bacterium]